MTTNPERLWVCGWERGGYMRWHAVDEKERFNVVDVPSAPAEYVRADVAAAKEEAARAQSKEGWKSFGEAMALVQAEADEKHALRAEVEALRSLAKRAADLLRPSFRLTVDGRDTPPNALVADIDAALAKGVG